MGFICSISSSSGVNCTFRGCAFGILGRNPPRCNSGPAGFAASARFASPDFAGVRFTALGGADLRRSAALLLTALELAPSGEGAEAVPLTDWFWVEATLLGAFVPTLLGAFVATLLGAFVATLLGAFAPTLAAATIDTPEGGLGTVAETGISGGDDPATRSS